MFSSIARELNEDLAGNELIVALSNSSEVTVSTSAIFKAIHCSHDVAGGILGSDIIFTRDFYEDLLMDIRAENRCLLTGSPGIGKSHFQLYYLARILNPTLFGPLPPDCYGCTDAPKIVIRQEGNSMTVYDIENRVAYKCGKNKSLLGCFDPKVTLYLYEPGELETGPYYFGHQLPILATMPPVFSHYEYFLKNGAALRYMPIFTGDELLAAGNYLLEKGCVPEDMTELYSPHEIKKRYDKFGGIFSNILPTSVDKLTSVHEETRLAVDDYVTNLVKCGRQI